MLRSNGLLRAVTALLTVGFALQSATPLVGHACPMHGAVLAPVTAPAEAPVAELHHDHGGEATAAAHAGHDHAPAHPADAPNHSCDCATDCCGVRNAAIAVSSPRLLLPVAWGPESAPRNPAPRRPGAPVRLLPFPNGPPALPIG